MSDATQQPSKEQVDADAYPLASVTVQQYADEYVDDYELRGEDDEGRDAFYSPNEHEEMLVRDAINGLIADEDFVTLVGKEYIERQKRRAAEGCCLGCGAPAGDHWGIRPECSQAPTPEPCPGCAKFVRMQHDIARRLGVDADTDSIDLHGRIYGAVSSAEPVAEIHSDSLRWLVDDDHPAHTCGHANLYMRPAQPPGPVPVGLPALFTEIRHLLGRTIECFDEDEEERKDLVDMLSKLSAQPFCPKCGPTVMNCEWRCCKCGADMKDGLPPAAYSTSTKESAP